MFSAATFDRYRQGDSLLHRLDPRVKVLVTLFYIVSNVALPDGAWTAFGASWLFLLLAARLGQLSPGLLLRRSLIALPFLLAALSVLFTLPGRTLWSARILTWTVAISDAGLLRFFSILVRSWLSVQMAILLTATTTFPDLMHALRHLRVPGVLVAIISFMYRYLFVLAGEANRLMRARAARSARRAQGDGGSAAGGSLWWRARVAGSMVGQLFLRSYERSERVYNAMLSRGYRGQLLTMNPHVMTRRDWLVGLGAMLLLAVIQVGGRL
jgi:cobalt/nickel transport system permease protein